MAAHAGTYGQAVREERERKGLSQNKLAELAGISRRHLASLEKGANVSIGILTAVTRVLGISELDLGGGLTVRDRAVKIAASDLLPFVDEMEREAARVKRLAKNLRMFAKTGVGKSVRNDTPIGEAQIRESVAHLVQLAMQFAEQVRDVRDPAQLERLERDVSDLLRSTA